MATLMIVHTANSTYRVETDTGILVHETFSPYIPPEDQPLRQFGARKSGLTNWEVIVGERASFDFDDGFWVRTSPVRSFEVIG
jgi:hypothetical protein